MIKITKLSDAIEFALAKGIYEDSSWFMCWAFEWMRMSGAISQDQESLFTGAVMGEVQHICPGAQALEYALHWSGQVCTLSEQPGHAITTQWYVWYAFDLRRKGL